MNQEIAYTWFNVPRRGGKPVREIGFEAPPYIPTSALTPLCVFNLKAFNICDAVKLIQLFNSDLLFDLRAENREHERRLDAFRSRFWLTYGFLSHAIGAAIHDAGGMAGEW
jgi:hypothetical protein